METVIKSKWFKIAAISAGVIVLALVFFASGVSVGFHKAKFSCKWGENYERNFMGSHSGSKGMMRQFEGRGFRNAHGLAGTILSITDSNIVIKDRDNKENTVAVTEQTVIKNRQDDVKIVDLKAGDEIVVMGNPAESGVVNATLIRVFNGGLDQ
jgi:hypothetical protein